jgi:hypothetical protein
MAKWPHEEVSEQGRKLPADLYKVKVTSQVDTEARNGQFMIKASGRIMEPKAFRAQPLDLNFVIGVTGDTAVKLSIESGEDLAAENEETWMKNPSARRYKAYLKALGVASTGDTEEEAEDAVGKVFFVQFEEKGNYNEAVAFYAEDAAPPLANGHDKPTNPPGKVTAKSKPRTGETRPKDEKGDDDWAN